MPESPPRAAAAAVRVLRRNARGVPPAQRRTTRVTAHHPRNRESRQGRTGDCRLTSAGCEMML